jgi:hypothetical protein
VRLRHVIGGCSLALLSMSCKLGDSTDAGSINLYVDVSDSRITVGQDIVTFTVTARNVGFDPLTLTGPSDCLLYIEIFNASGSLVWTSNNSCAPGNVTVELAAGQDKVAAIDWDGRNTAGAFLGPGLYLVRPIARTTGSATIGPPLTVALD